ncbi:MAG: hypothetical protein CMR00_03800 [[Chlorobium] sp. 445]|nr:MAG: hypothetical protein CMR00_03800 [[Chlorobium] sp. 445]
MAISHAKSDSQLNHLLKVTKLTLLGELIGSVLHELNQPLTAMSIDAGYLKMLAEKSGEVTAEMLHQIGDDIESDIARFQKITEHLRTFAYEREKTLQTNLKSAVENVMGLIGEQFRARAIRWTYNQEENLPLVTIDIIELEYILLNLFLNARKAIEVRERLFPEKPFQKYLCLKAWSSSEGISMLVKDSGLSLAQINLDKLGQPFATAQVEDEILYYSLFLVSEILEKIGGKWQVHDNLNDEGVGNAIELLLPASTST